MVTETTGIHTFIGIDSIVYHLIQTIIRKKPPTQNQWNEKIIDVLDLFQMVKNSSYILFRAETWTGCFIHQATLFW